MQAMSRRLAIPVSLALDPSDLEEGKTYRISFGSVMARAFQLPKAHRQLLRTSIGWHVEEVSCPHVQSQGMPKKRKRIPQAEGPFEA